MHPHPPSSHPSFSLLSLVSRTRPFRHLPPSSNLSPVSFRPFPSPSRHHPGCLDSRHYTCSHHHLHLSKSSHARRFPVAFTRDHVSPSMSTVFTRSFLISSLPCITLQTCLVVVFSTTLPSGPCCVPPFVLLFSLPCISLPLCLVVGSQFRVDSCPG